MTAAIHLARAGFKISLFEKDDYPRHKVCGEYVSQEILSYFSELGINLYELRPPEITRLQFSTKNGKCIETDLPLGGLGISRYALDNFLYEKALSFDNIEFINQKVESVVYEENIFNVETKTGVYSAKIVLGAYGKRSNLDKTLGRRFMSKKTRWLAVKAHYDNDDFPEDLVALHNFDGGYCGLSKTEAGTVNVCFLTTYKSFKTGKKPLDFKNKVLCKNPHLKTFFDTSENLFEKDLSIAQISFSRKKAVHNHILMLGDSAGLIHPLCGNGMAMAIHSAKLASETILDSWNGKVLERMQLEKTYKRLWNEHFKDRMRMSKVLQQILLRPWLTNFSQKIINVFPSLLPKIIKRTHGHFGL